MKRSARGLWINWLLVGLALGSVGLVLSSTGVPTTLEREAREHNLLAAYRRDEVTRIEFERTEGGFTLEREASSEASPGFRISAPFQEEAAPEAVGAILGTLNFAAFVRRVPDDAVDRAAFGLDAPRLVLHLEMGKIRYRLRLGTAPQALAGDSYLEVSGEGAPAKGVYVVRRAFIDEIDVAVDKFRGRQLVSYGRAAIAALKLGSTASSFELRRDRGRFRVKSGSHDIWLDRDGEERLFMALARLKLERFLPLDEAETALKQAPALRIEISPSAANSPTSQLEFGGQCPGDPALEIAVRRSPGVLAGCVSKSILAELKVDPERLVDLRLFGFRLEEVKGLEVTNAGQQLELVRTKDGFELKRPESGKVESDVAEDRLKGLLSLSGTLVFDKTPSELGLSQASSTVVIHGSGNEPSVRDEAVSLVFEGNDASVFALRQGDGAILRFHSLDRSLFDASALLLKSRQLFDVPAREVARIEIDTRDVKQTLVQTESGLELEAPKGFTVDSGLGHGLVDAVRSLRARRFVASSDTGQFGLGDPQGKITLTLKKAEGAAEPHVLLLGANTKGGVFAQVDRGGVFVLPLGVVDTFKTWALDRAVFLPLLSDVLRIRLRAPHAELDLEKSGEGFRQVGGNRELSSAELQQLLDELGVIRAEATAHLGAALPHEGFDRPTLELSTETANGGAGVKWVIGAADAWRDVAVYYGRVIGKDATFVVPRRHIRRIVDAL